MSHFYFLGGPLDGEHHAIPRDHKGNIPTEIVYERPAARLLATSMTRKDAYPIGETVQVTYTKQLRERKDDGAKALIYVTGGKVPSPEDLSKIFWNVPIDTHELARREVPMSNRISTMRLPRRQR